MTQLQRIYGFSFSYMALILIPVIVPYFLDIGLTMSEVYGLQALFGLTVVVLEVPSGYLSDLWGRRRTLICGSIMNGIGFTILALADSFSTLALAEVLLGMSLSLVSGTDISLLCDRITEDSTTPDPDFAPALGNLQFAATLGETVASIIGGFIAIVSLKHAAWSQMIAAWIPLMFALSLREPAREAAPKSTHRENVREIFRILFRQSRRLNLLTVNLIVWGLATFVAVWVYQKLWQDAGIALGSFGLIWAAYNFTVGVVGKVAYQIQNTIGQRTSYVLIAALPIAGYLAMAHSVGPGLVAAGFLFQVSRGLNQVLLRGEFNRYISGKFRATANSVVSMLFRGGFAIVGPLVGYSIDHQGNRWTLSIVGVFFLLAFGATMVPLLVCKSERGR